ncbi:uncharacterized protein LOC123524507 isoform X2 [Mercenaria mercenaria]|uniref:uncharacterized protein LOC123524507 isoform X2 n=1 Tax=Mercenaria mercenaria TaxID=6596 RepID=UPI00234F2CF4|nr:uncharacterized protein LOC123524507 isoform X2 [Mercenaria mercenaria]
MILGRCARSFGDFKMCRRERPMKVTEALQTVVSKAIHEGRLVTGITEMAAVLKRFSGSGVMFCIVEVKSVEDLQMKLLEAYCREHHIKLIKVDHCHRLINCEKFSDIASASTDSYEEESAPATTSDKEESCMCRLTTDDLTEYSIQDKLEITCLLLTQPTHLTSEEVFVLSFYETYRNFRNEYPVLRIQDSVYTYQ